MLAPVLFVVLWSTGYIGTKLGLRDSPPFSLLTLRFCGAALLLVLLAWRCKVRWPSDPRVLAHLLVAGLLVHVLYLGLSFEANARGMPVSIISLIAVLQPMLTALGAAWLLGERVAPTQWIGLATSAIGVVLVLSDRIAFTPTLATVACALGSTLTLTAGTLYQKRFCADTDLLSGTALQFLAAAIVMAVASSLRDAPAIHWRIEFVLTLVWLIVINSVVTTLMLYWLIRRGAASRVTSLFYLVPVATSIMAYFLVDEAFGRYFVLGTVMTILGVMLAMHARPAQSPPG